MRLPIPAHVLHWLERSGLRVAVIAVLAWVVVRSVSLATRRFERTVSHDGPDAPERTKRVQTLTRIGQKTVSVVVTGMAALMILRELGADITPVLTGAGVAGVAVGFGAQTLVKDVISGFFLLLEDQIRVGDAVVVNGQAGVVEELNLRTIVLRDIEGAVHVFPNGEVKTLANRSKDFAYYVLDIPVPADEDIDVVAGHARRTAAALQAEAPYAAQILAPLEVLGVDAFTAGHLVLRTRIKTIPMQQWEVGRELRKRVAIALTAAGIPLATSRVDVRLEGPAGVSAVVPTQPTDL